MKKYWWLLLIIAFHLVFNLIYLNLNKTPPAWDQAAHLKSAVVWNKALLGKTNLSFKALVNQSWGYPPLIFVLGGLWSMFYGIGVVQITFLNTLFLISGIIGVHLLTKELTKSDLAANLAAFVFSFFPVIFDISRSFSLDLPLTVFVIFGFWTFLKSKYLSDFKYSSLFVLFVILSSLTKLNGFLYFVPIGLFWLGYSIKYKQIENFKKLMVMAVAYLFGVGWWWIVNWQNIYSYLTGLAGSGEPLTDPMNLLSSTTWFYYFKLFSSQQIGIILTIVFLISLFLFGKKLSKERRWLIWLFLIVNYLMFTIIKNKDYRFTMPMLPMVAVIIGIGLEKINSLNKTFFKILIGFLSLFLIFNYFCNSFEWPIKKEYKLSLKMPLVGWIDFVNISEYPVKSAKTTVWPQKQIIKDISNDTKVLVLINREEINDNNLWLYKELASKTMNFESVGTKSRFESEEEIKTLVDSVDYMLVPDRSYESAPFYVINLEANNQTIDYILNRKEEWQLVNTYKIFNGKDLFLFRKM